jgi:hypothetical protein
MSTGQVMDVEVPYGAMPGQTMLVQAPTGQRVSVRSEIELPFANYLGAGGIQLHFTRRLV